MISTAFSTSSRRSYGHSSVEPVAPSVGALLFGVDAGTGRGCVGWGAASAMKAQTGK